MYFEIENTPEHVKRSRRTKVLSNNSTIEECPRLVLAPFSRQPQVVFDNVLIGTCCEKDLEVYNPTKQVQQITLDKELPPGLVLQLPGEWIILEPETCYCLKMKWTPTQPTALRATIRFINENRGRYDAVVVLKSAMTIKGKSKGFKTSPGKMKKKSGKRSPGAIYKKKAEVIYNANQTKKTSVKSTHYDIHASSNKENISAFEYSVESHLGNCPFDSPTNKDFNFDTTEIFSNMRKTKTENILYDTYDKSYTPINKLAGPVPENHVLKASNKPNYDISASELFDNITFTPLKNGNSKIAKLDKGPNIIISMNSEDGLDDSLNVKTSNNEYVTHSIITATQPSMSNMWLDANYQQKQIDNQVQFVEASILPNKKIPNTSSPKELNSPNFTMNTELSRISDFSFCPQRFSTEKKIVAKLDDENEFFNDPNHKKVLSSDTYTKDSPNTPLDFQLNQVNEEGPPHFFLRDQSKVCRQALFKEPQRHKECFENNYFNTWNRDIESDVKSPPRSITPPPLQSIPEESANLCDTQVLDKTDKQMSTFRLPINRTFDKSLDRNSMSTSTRHAWSKKSIRGEPELWKIPTHPPRKSIKAKANIANKKDKTLNDQVTTTLEENKIISQNITLHQVGNVYSQSATADPFLSASYFYDEESVHRFEAEFKRWLNCILTPAADLDSNIEQTIDIGKAWIENRNKEVPLAPTREQVSSVYHNSHRLESLRRSARVLLMSPEITQVIEKLNAQIEKKLIAIRNDRNLHLDVGLQKAIMELLLSYNPLWLRIGLEAIYKVTLPLKSNSDIDGLTSFIIQRMFKNPFLKNKHCKSTVPNMLRPAYMEAIKKFTLKKFFTLVFFLDQAKQKKLISHDPCLFCRNAICKESRDIIVRFTRELIAGIGDITKHLRPLGYVVCHKQSYLDEYKYAVHNIALDIRDGVRLTKVMEIILMRNGLLNHLRTPPISRLQKIHNVHVALNALKEANFVINGDITAQDIADGHREKTLSLLWQLIHVFRAPLFEKAASIIQTWWRKKYEVILEKRKEQEMMLQKSNDAAITIQYWWRRIQYNRLVEWKMKQITSATIVVQKYCRMWLCRSRFLKTKKSILEIEGWYRSVCIIKEARARLEALRIEREKLKQKSAIVLQSNIRRWLCMKEYRNKIQKVILIQSIIRCYILKKHYIKLKESTKYIQDLYRRKLLMREEMKSYAKKRNAAITIQSYYKMTRERRRFQRLKKSVIIIEERFIALIKMRQDFQRFQLLKKSAIVIQARYNSLRCRKEYLRKRCLIVTLQQRIKAYLLMKKEFKKFLRIKNAAITIQRHIKSFQMMKRVKENYFAKRNSTVLIQRRFRAYKLMKTQRESYNNLRNAAITIQKHYRALLAMRQARSSFAELKSAVIVIQRTYRAQLLMRRNRDTYMQLRIATIIIQRKYRSLIKMRSQRQSFLKIRSSTIMIQTRLRANMQMKADRTKYVTTLKSCIIIQRAYRAYLLGKKEKARYLMLKKTVVIVQQRYRALLAMRRERKSYAITRTAIINTQRRFRAKIRMTTERSKYQNIVKASVKIQRAYRAYVVGNRQRKEFIRIIFSTIKIQSWYRRTVETRRIRSRYLQLIKTVIVTQRRFRAKLLAREIYREEAARKIQIWFRTLQNRNKCREQLLRVKASAIFLQSTFRMIIERKRFRKLTRSAIIIQRYYRSHKLTLKQRQKFIETKTSIIKLQSYVRTFIHKKRYLKVRSAVITIQKAFKSKKKMEFLKLQQETAAVCIQKNFRRYIAQSRYQNFRKKVIFVQSVWRGKLVTRLLHCEYLQKRRMIVKLQARLRGFLVRKDVHCKRVDIQKKKEEQRRNRSASIIQAYYRGYAVRTANTDKRVAELCRRWRAGALKSNQESLKERNEKALRDLNLVDIEIAIRAFQSLELLSEVFPMMYNENASDIACRTICWMMVMNRSISCIELLKSAAGFLVNLARYKVTGPKIYDKDHIAFVLKLMCRFSNSEPHLLCILCTYLWLFSKYDDIKKDLTDYLNIPENQRMLSTIKCAIERMKRMEKNTRNKFSTPRTSKFVSSTPRQSSLNFSECLNKSEIIILPALEPNYSITRTEKPKHFENAYQAITCLFQTYNL